MNLRLTPSALGRVRLDSTEKIMEMVVEDSQYHPICERKDKRPSGFKLIGWKKLTSKAKRKSALNRKPD